MSYPELSWLLMVGVVLVSLASIEVGGAERPPNIVFLLADDLGYGDLHCYGHPYSRTPHLDQLAKEGTRFTQFCVTGITCCPSRTGFMTGKFPATFQKYPANGGFGERVTVTELLKQRGYATGHFGKWHIGPETKAGTYGIDVTPNSADDPSRGKRRDEWGRDAIVYDAAIRFIEQHHDQPFYVNVWGHTTHHPVNPPPAYAEKFSDLVVKETDFAPFMREKFAIAKERGGDVNAGMRNYLGDVLALDDSVGRLLKRIDELGLREKTIVVFSSDHGSPTIRPTGEEPKKNREKKNKAPDASREELTLNLMGYNGGLQGGKHGMYEGGVRVPFIIRWPGQVPADRVDEASVISAIDWLPTVCRLAGAKLPQDDFDGEDVSAAWLGKSAHVRTKPLFWKTSSPPSDIGVRHGKWKLHYPNRKRGEVQLYDVVADARETTNVAAQHPEVVKSLVELATKWQATLPKEYEKTEDKQD